MRKKWNGYFTVEAAMVLPIVLFGILFSMQCFLFSYNRCLLQQDLHRIAIYSSFLYEQQKGRENDNWMENWKEDCRSYGSELFGEKYIAWSMDTEGVLLEKKGNRVMVTGEGRLLLENSNWLSPKPEQFVSTETAESEIEDPVYTLRQIRKGKKKNTKEKIVITERKE